MTGPLVAVASVVVLAPATAWARQRSAAARVHRRLEPAPCRPPIGPAPAWVVDRLDDCGLDLDPSTVWLAGRVVLPGIGLLAGVLAGPAFAVLVTIAAAASPLLLVATLQGRGDRSRGAAVAPLLEAVAASLRSGATVALAVRECAARPPSALAADLAAVVRRLDSGQRLAASLAEWARHRPLPEVRLAVAALTLAVDAGGRSARAVDGVAATVRSRSAVAAEARALGTQARYSAAVIATAPLAFGALAAAADPDRARFLAATPIGLAMLAGGLALDAAGWWWMARITARVG